MSSYLEGQVHQLMDAFQKAGFTPGDITALGQCSELGEIKRFLNGELVFSQSVRKWVEEKGLILFTVTSDGTTGSSWIRRLRDGGLRVSSLAKGILRAPNLNFTSGVTHNVVVLSGRTLAGQCATTRNIISKADSLGLESPNAEVALLMQEMFSGRELIDMGLSSIFIFHKPVNISNEALLRLSLNVDLNNIDGHCRLETVFLAPEYAWFPETGFAFVSPQAVV